MARGQKTDIETKAKIIEAKINTDAQWSEIARELDVPERTVQNILKNEFAEICGKSEKVAQLIDRNDNLMSIADNYLTELIVKKDEKVTAGHLVSLRESAFKQNQLLTWGATENVRNIDSVDIL